MIAGLIPYWKCSLASSVGGTRLGLFHIAKFVFQFYQVLDDVKKTFISISISYIFFVLVGFNIYHYVKPCQITISVKCKHKHLCVYLDIYDYDCLSELIDCICDITVSVCLLL